MPMKRNMGATNGLAHEAGLVKVNRFMVFLRLPLGSLVGGPGSAPIGMKQRLELRCRGRIQRIPKWMLLECLCVSVEPDLGHQLVADAADRLDEAWPLGTWILQLFAQLGDENIDAAVARRPVASGHQLQDGPAGQHATAMLRFG